MGKRNGDITRGVYLTKPGRPRLVLPPTTPRMFTGLVNNLSRIIGASLLKKFPQIEHLGIVVDIKRDEGGCTLTIGDSAPILGDCHIGDSIAVNGACLTVVEFNKEEKGGWFTVWLANETLDKTDLGAQRRLTSDCIP